MIILAYCFQLKVKDVHLRYEDNVTIPGSSFACGITIKSLSAQSTDSSWVGVNNKYNVDRYEQSIVIFMHLLNMYAL
jgi:hypothetical protein